MDFTQQGANLNVTTHLTTFLNNLVVNLTAATTAKSDSQTHSLLLFNYETLLSTNFHPNTTKTDRNNVTLQLNDTDWFNGSRLRYEIACDKCGESIIMKQHIQPVQKLNLRSQLFYKNEAEGFAWIVTNDTVFQIDGSGNFTRTILQLPEDEYSCTAAAVSTGDSIGLLACLDT